MKRTRLLVAVSALLTITPPLYAQQPDPAAALITRAEATDAFTKINSKVNAVRDSLRATNSVAHQALARASAPTQTVVRQVPYTGDGHETLKALGPMIQDRYEARLKARVLADAMKLTNGDTTAAVNHPYYKYEMAQLKAKGPALRQAAAAAFVADLVAALDRPAPVAAPPATSENALWLLTERVERNEIRLADTEDALQQTLARLGGFAKNGKRRELAQAVGAILADYKP